MNREQTLNISTSKGNWLIAIKPCNRERDGQFIRELTKQSCFDYLNNTIGWNEEIHRQEPRFPERYLILFEQNKCIGFLSLRSQIHSLYLETLQLIPEYRRRGIGAKLLVFIEDIAREQKKAKIRLRVINGNPARSLYYRNGFKVVEEQEWCILMEKVLQTHLIT